MPIRNPLEWGYDQIRTATLAVESASQEAARTERDTHRPLPTVRRIEIAHLGEVLARGVADFGSNRSDVLFLCVIYPVVGLVLARMALGDMLPLIFPLAAGFALVGPFAAVGLYEMSRRRERGLGASWADAFGVVRSPAFGSIVVLGLLLTALFLLWLVIAGAIYKVTLGPNPPASVAGFLHDLFTTGPGWAMIVVGTGVGFLFALLVMSISVVSFPLLLDRNVGIETAVLTSIRAVLVNPAPMAAWGMIVAGGLLVGSVPLFLGLIIVMPVLGHATWHLYRYVVAD